MFLKFSYATSLLVGLCEIVSAEAVGNFKRQTTDSSFGLYAYGTNISGLPVFYGDGLCSKIACYTMGSMVLTSCLGVAYIGRNSPPGVAESVNITCKYHFIP